MGQLRYYETARSDQFHVQFIICYPHLKWLIREISSRIQSICVSNSTNSVVEFLGHFREIILKMPTNLKKKWSYTEEWRRKGEKTNEQQRYAMSKRCQEIQLNTWKFTLLLLKNGVSWLRQQQRPHKMMSKNGKKAKRWKKIERNISPNICLCHSYDWPNSILFYNHIKTIANGSWSVRSWDGSNEIKCNALIWSLTTTFSHRPTEPLWIGPAGYISCNCAT